MNPTREKISKKYPWSKNPTRENSRKSAREAKFFAREKYGKNPKIGREKKKSGREKSPKSRKKWAWKANFARENFRKKAKKWLHAHFWVSRPKKKTLIL